MRELPLGFLQMQQKELLVVTGFEVGSDKISWDHLMTGSAF